MFPLLFVLCVVREKIDKQEARLIAQEARLIALKDEVNRLTADLK